MAETIRAYLSLRFANIMIYSGFQGQIDDLLKVRRFQVHVHVLLVSKVILTLQIFGVPLQSVQTIG
jgi:hypothetical protein